MTTTHSETLDSPSLVPAFDLEMITDSWDGSWIRLQQNQSVNMPQTSNSEMTFVAFSFSKDEGKVRLVSGANPSVPLTVKGSLNAPVPYLHNFKGNNLKVTNISAVKMEIWIAAYRFGQNRPKHLPNDGTPVTLRPFEATQGAAAASEQTLRMQSPGNYSVFTLQYNGKAYIYAVNAPDEIPEGYTDKSPNNSLEISKNFLGAELYVANLSPYKSGEGTVTLL